MVLYPREFEQIDYRSDRLKVPNGWIIRTMYGDTVHTFFLPDDGHTWRLEEKKEEWKRV